MEVGNRVGRFVNVEQSFEGTRMDADLIARVYERLAPFGQPAMSRGHQPNARRGARRLTVSNRSVMTMQGGQA